MMYILVKWINNLKGYHLPATIHICFLAAALSLLSFSSIAQVSTYAVSGIITDYNGLWQSSVASPSPIIPDNSHDLLAFTFHGITYSTGVNNGKLAGITYVPGSYQAIEVSTLGVATANTKIALGQLYDGVDNGPSNPAPDRDMLKYLKDGINGLNIGTGVANVPNPPLPNNYITFSAKNIQPSTIGDSIPDIIVTQIADPSPTAPDKYSFHTVTNTRIGREVDIVFSTTAIPAVGTWLGDFYEASQNPMTLGTTPFRKSTRQIRLWAADLSSFGITKDNYSSIDNFRIVLSGSSDLAFVAYNSYAFDLPLPVSLVSFEAKTLKGNNELSWATMTESQNQQFVIEVSEDAKVFTAVDSIAGAGNNAGLKQYSYLDEAHRVGTTYYRLKQVDYNGRFTYSKVIVVQSKTEREGITLIPNPVTNKAVIVRHQPAGGEESLQIWDIKGRLLLEKSVTTGVTETILDTKNLSKGIYQVVWLSAKVNIVSKLVVQ